MRTRTYNKVQLVQPPISYAMIQLVRKTNLTVYVMKITPETYMSNEIKKIAKITLAVSEGFTFIPK